MGEGTAIGWTNDTVNVWIGCTKVSADCKHCYAEEATPTRVYRAKGLELWGANAARKETKAWAQHLRRWNREAAASGKVRRVFGQSLSDTFEDRADLDDMRTRFFAVVEECTALTFQLLTKRPENICAMVPASWLKSWPGHVWIGATVESQAMAEERVPHLLRVPAPVLFVSVEPQIEAVNLRRLLANDPVSCPHADWMDPLTGHGRGDMDGLDDDPACTSCFSRISWVIQGGESGSKGRPFDLAWARSLRDQCSRAGVAYFLKQLGTRPILGSFVDTVGGPLDFAYTYRDSHGADESEWPADLRGCRAFPR